jgi:hypothetical protein
VKRWRTVLASGVFILACAIWLYGASHSAVLDAGLAAEEIYQRAALSRGRPVDAAEERVLAGAYWQRNPDVANDTVFGEQGRFGIFGAREHYERHGRREGRQWGR